VQLLQRCYGNSGKTAGHLAVLPIAEPPGSRISADTSTAFADNFREKQQNSGKQHFSPILTDRAHVPDAVVHPDESLAFLAQTLTG